ncbi:peptidase MA family metallohydrolase [Roseisolibacter agri]|uniref:Peptidase MA-like domain-containing protein n=1 Tax=Roseisolibacter agri TaxID=2014610 RepID=A0AA37QHD3_9BACT|nr:hypothetical protein [Roseisolibacter agri]GLC26475.1 hypothetical protein rosag_29880 [Roseisolibacter agri]
MRALVGAWRVLPLLALLASLALAQGSRDSLVPRGAERFDAGRFTVVAYPADRPLARSLLAEAQRRDTFPGLPRPHARVLIAVAPDARRFRDWIGPAAPEWGAAIAFPALQRIVMQGRTAGSDAGDPRSVLRHELAHLALHEALGDLPPRWFDEGYASFAAGEWGRDETLATNLTLLARGMPTLDTLEAGFYEGAAEAEASYALAFRAVSDLSELDRERGLTLFFRYWKETGRFDAAVRQAYGITATAFEKQWQERTRRRYGMLALVANLSLATSIFLVAFLPLWIMRRRRDRRRLEALRQADEIAEREARALDALLGETPVPDAAPEPPRG